MAWLTKAPAASMLALLGLAGCASVQSQFAKTSTPDGLVYFMPMRQFVVTIACPPPPAAAPAAPPAECSTAAGPLPTVTVAAGPAEPDLTQRFVLSQGVNQLASVELNVTVGANGLLQTGNTTSTSEVITALQNAAAAAGSITPLLMGARLAAPPLPPPPPQPPCPTAGETFQYLIDPKNAGAADAPAPPTAIGCNLIVVVTPLSVAPPISSDRIGRGAGQPGFFYRHELPYVVTVKDAAGAQWFSSVLFSSSASEIDFFPINRNFFANNTAKTSFTDGVLTSVDQTKDGELAAALSAPAAVISSYTTALGNTLTGLTTNSGDLQKLVAQQQATATAQAQNTVCKATIAANQAELAGPNGSKAAAAIQAACAPSP